VWAVMYHVKFSILDFDCNNTQFAVKSEIVNYLDHIIKLSSFWIENVLFPVSAYGLLGSKLALDYSLLLTCNPVWSC
jgi:hypothetical protein